MKNYKEYKAWCEEYGRLPRANISINGIRVAAASKGAEETKEQVEQRLGGAKIGLLKKDKLTEEEQTIKELYEELKEQYKKESTAMKNYKEYKAWCEQHGKLPRAGISGVNAAKKGEKETKEQIEQRLGVAKFGLFKKDKLTEEEQTIKELYEELKEQYKKESTAMKNYKEYKAWCEQHGELPRQSVNVNGKPVKSAKKGEKETEEQVEQRLGLARRGFFSRNEDTLTEEAKEIRRLYEELTEQYGKKQPARNIAPTVKNVSISESKEAEEFMETITNEKDKKGVSHNDE